LLIKVSDIRIYLLSCVNAVVYLTAAMCECCSLLVQLSCVNAALYDAAVCRVHICLDRAIPKYLSVGD
jgi:hypothetical protein